MSAPVCPTCGQPASEAISDDGSWECRNEACPEFGQILSPADHAEEEPAPEPPSAADA